MSTTTIIILILAAVCIVVLFLGVFMGSMLKKYAEDYDPETHPESYQNIRRHTPPDAKDIIRQADGLSYCVDFHRRSAEYIWDGKERTYGDWVFPDPADPAAATPPDIPQD